jgi:hypothetical protein
MISNEALQLPGAVTELPVTKADVRGEESMRSFLVSIGAGILMALVFTSSFVIGFTAIGPQLEVILRTIGA